MVTHVDMSTRELKAALNDSRTLGWSNDDDQVFIGVRMLPGGKGVGVYATEDQIRAELRNRPHVPSAREAKLLRQLMSKTGQSADWLRAHPKYGTMLVDVQHPNRREVTADQVPRLKVLYGSMFATTHKVVKKKR